MYTIECKRGVFCRLVAALGNGETQSIFLSRKSSEKCDSPSGKHDYCFLKKERKKEEQEQEQQEQEQEQYLFTCFFSTRGQH